MNDRKFLELLNLYIDGEIKPPDAVALELEVKTNPARRKTYNQYCRLHRATLVVCERFREASVEDAGGHITALQNAVRIPSQQAAGSVIDPGRTSSPWRFRRAGLWAAAGLAACAALTVSVVLRQAEPVVANADPASGVQKIVASSQPAADTTSGARLRRVATFAVPSAPEVRRDPYVIEFRPAGLNRFSTPTGTFEGFNAEPFPSADGFTSLRFASGSGTSIDFLAPTLEISEQPESRVFRARPSTSSEGLQPVNFQPQR
jgi:hypothetical protein